MSVPASLPQTTLHRRSQRLVLGLMAALLAVVGGIVLYLVLAADIGGGSDDVLYPGPGSRLDYCLNTTGHIHC